MFVDLDVIKEFADKGASDSSDIEWMKKHGTLWQNPSRKELLGWDSHREEGYLKEYREIMSSLTKAQEDLQENHPEILDELRKGD